MIKNNVAHLSLMHVYSICICDISFFLFTFFRNVVLFHSSMNIEGDG